VPRCPRSVTGSLRGGPALPTRQVPGQRPLAAVDHVGHEAREQAGITEEKLKPAKKRLNVKSNRVGEYGRWFMYLPQHEGQFPGQEDTGQASSQKSPEGPSRAIWPSSRLGRSAGTSGFSDPDGPHKLTKYGPEDLSTSEDGQKSKLGEIGPVGTSGETDEEEETLPD